MLALFKYSCGYGQ